MSSENSNLDDCKCLCYTHVEYTLILYHDQAIPHEATSTVNSAIEGERVVDEIEAGLLDMVRAFLESIQAKEYNLNPENLAVGLTVRDARLKKGVSEFPMIVTLQQHLSAIQGSSSLSNYFEILAGSYFPDKHLKGKNYSQQWVDELKADEALAASGVDVVPHFDPLVDIGIINWFSKK
jgi:hypothetical protein